MRPPDRTNHAKLVVIEHGIRIGPRWARWSEELRMGRWTNWTDLACGVVSLLRGRTVFSTMPHLGGELVFDRPVPVEIDGEPMRGDRVKIQALSRPLLLRVPHGQRAS